MHPRNVIALAVMLASCGGDDAEPSPAEPRADAPPEALLAQDGALAASDPTDGRGRYDRYFVDVAANDRVIVTLTSTAFDPTLEITPPGSGALVNDDFQGDTARSQIELLAPAAGSMKIEVRSYRRDALGAYRVEARRVASGGDVSVPLLAAGQTVEGELAEADHALSGGDLFDSFMVHAEGAVQIAVETIGGGEAPRTTLVGPSGLTLEPTARSTYDAPDAGNYRLQVIGRRGTRYRVEVSSASAGGAPILARAHHQFNEFLERLGGRAAPSPASPGSPTDPAAPRAPTPLPVRVGDRLSGSLASSDARLPSGELYDVYELTVTAPAGEVSVEMESPTSLDCFLRVEGPGGQHWENDDYGGTLSSRVDLALTAPGTYRIVTTSYRPGATGAYELKVQARRDDPVAGAPAGPEQTFPGQLASGDRTLQTGELFDEHRFTWAPGTRVHLEVRSTAFDTYLIVHPPSGPQRDNDDLVPGQNLNAGLDIQVSEPGEWRVIATSYQPNQTGDYTLVVSGGDASAPSATPTPPTPPTPTPAPAPTAGGRTETGTLAQGDRTLSSGEYTDVFTRSFTPRSAVSIRLDSTDFDPYLIVRTPSGTQEDNDDYQAPALNSGLDIPVAEPGTYTITVTSYRPGETGSYTLRTSEGPSVVSAPTPTPTPDGTPPAAGAGGRVWGLFAGISDYQGSANDLPECANDARKLAEAVRLQGNMPQDQEFLLTDAQATTANIRQALSTIAQGMRPDDVLVFFYSGHGGQTDSSQDTRELDARDEYLVAYDGNLMDDELGRLFDGIRGRVALVAIDACFAGGFAKDVITRPGRVGMFSSEEDVTSAVAGRFQAGGYLSHFLRLGIQGAADNDPNNAILTVGELTHYTWVQFGQHASDVRMSMGYQHLVVDRGAVHTTEVLWAVNR